MSEEKYLSDTEEEKEDNRHYAESPDSDPGWRPGEIEAYAEMMVDDSIRNPSEK